MISTPTQTESTFNDGFVIVSEPSNWRGEPNVHSRAEINFQVLRHSGEPDVIIRGDVFV